MKKMTLLDERHDQLPSWLLHGWNQHAEEMREADIEGI